MKKKQNVCICFLALTKCSTFAVENEQCVSGIAYCCNNQ